MRAGSSSVMTRTYAKLRGLSRTRRWQWAVGAAFVALTIVLVAVNFMTAEMKIQHRLVRMYSVESPQFALELSALLGPSLVPGNQVTALFNGDQIFPPMLDAIRDARTSIDFESNIYWSGPIGKQFADALSERAQHGVSVLRCSAVHPRAAARAWS
jgi:cardiolipin synthase